MRHQLIHFREERDLGQKINATFGFIRQNARQLLKNLLFIAVPWAVVAGIFGGISQYRRVTVDRDFGHYGSWGAFDLGRQVTSLHYLLSMFFLIVSFILVGLTIYAYIVSYMDNDGKVEPGAVRKIVKENFLTVLGSGIGAAFLIILGYVMLLIPGIYLSTAFSLFLIVMVREGSGFVDTMERCLDLVKGNWWETFWTLVVVGIIQNLIALIAYSPSFILGILQAAQIPGAHSQVLTIAATSFASVVSIIFYSISLVAIAFQYFNLVEKKEGIGYLALADQIGMATTAAETEEDEY